MSIHWDGLDELMERLDVDDAPRIIGIALWREAQNIMTKSKKITPVDTGALRASGWVQSPRYGRTGATVTLAYGVNYAIYVHEISSHRVTAGPVFHKSGQAKFLEGPVKAAAKGLDRRLAVRIKGLLK